LTRTFSFLKNRLLLEVNI